MGSDIFLFLSMSYLCLYSHFLLPGITFVSLYVFFVFFSYDCGPAAPVKTCTLPYHLLTSRGRHLHVCVNTTDSVCVLCICVTLYLPACLSSSAALVYFTNSPPCVSYRSFSQHVNTLCFPYLFNGESRYYGRPLKSGQKDNKTCMWNKSSLWSKTFKVNFVFKLNKNSYGAHTGNNESNVAHCCCFIFLFVQGYMTTTGSLDISIKKSQRKKTQYILKHKFSFCLSRTDVNKRHLTLVKCARLSADRFPQTNQTSPNWLHIIFT